MADRQVPGILVLLFALLAVVSVALATLWAVTLGFRALALMVGFATYFLLAHVYLPFRVYVDARERGSASATAWTALAFVFPFVGAAIYFLFARRSRTR